MHKQTQNNPNPVLRVMKSQLSVPCAFMQEHKGLLEANEQYFYTLEGKICLLPANDFDKLESYLGKQGKWDILK